MWNKLLSILVFFNVAFFVNAEQLNSTSLFIVHFKTGPSWNNSLPPQQQIQFQAHAKNLRLLREQKLIQFGARYSDFGVIIIRGDSLEQVKSLMAVDPGVAAGIFTVTVEALNVFYPWRD